MRTGLSIGIFIPVYHRTEKVINSLESLMKTYVPRGMQLHAAIGINGASVDLNNYIQDFSGRHKSRWASCRLFPKTENIGKPRIVNYMVSTIANETHLDYVLSYDSDMVVEDELWLAKYVDAFEQFLYWSDLGALAAQQSGECCHIMDKDPIRYKSQDFNYVTRAGNEGVAGGALLTPYHVWRTIGGYHAHRIYASDDGHYALSCAQRGLLMCIVNEVVLRHPENDDPAYSAWKHRAVADKLSEDERLGFYK